MDQDSPNQQTIRTDEGSTFTLRSGGGPDGTDRPPYQTDDPFRVVKAFFNIHKRLFTNPKGFFREVADRDPQGLTLSGPIAFALTTHWIGAALSLLMRSLIPQDLSGMFRSMVQMAGDVAQFDDPSKGPQLLELQNQFVHWMWGVGSVILDPFLTLVSILFTCLFVFVGARLLVDRPTRFEHALQLVCYSMAPSLLVALPFAGGLLASFCTLILMVMGAREIYRVHTGKAVIIALFPKILFMASIAMIALFGLLFLFKTIATVF